ncbi:hypothetical protein MKZ38_000182 [Zalerion maritima]|uniref:Uncharacterized protein n=1 Tax=Zalerion maritima TaxID=339359 RepID=A0AAD5RFQ5_9PEZI|nr:hypothetical protein MKZ38_000182 [Zalerion maritima]
MMSTETREVSPMPFCQMPPGKNYMACGSSCSWTDFITLWGKANGVLVGYKQVTLDEMVADTADRGYSIEVAHMYSYSSDAGCDGGMDLRTVEDLQKAGIECTMASLEQWFARQHWPALLAK